MPTDRVLIMIETVANTAGIEKAQAGLLGLTSGTMAITAALGLAVVAGKSAIEISEKHQKAENDLAQAMAASGGSLKQAKTFLDDFIGSNRQFVGDQSEVIDAFATFTRAGLSAGETTLDMNRALDLAALKHISLSEAVKLVNDAEHGRLRGLIDLGITSKAYVDSSGNVINAQKNMGVVMYELDQKIAHGRETTTEMTQATNRLGNDWQDISNSVGPPLIGLLSLIVRGADNVVMKLKELAANKDWVNAVSAGLGAIQDWLIKVVKGFEDIVHAVQWLIEHGEAVAKFLGGAGTTAGAGGGRYKLPGRAGGGPVSAGDTYLVGERGPEYFTAGASGMITPGGGGAIHIHIDRGAYIDGPSTDRLANLIAQRLSYATGR